MPSRNDIKLEIDKVFVNLTMEQSGGESFDQATLLAAGPRIRVIGDPGSGKSSLVKRLFRDACRGALSSPSKSKFPVLVELRTLKIPRNVTDQRLGEWFYNLLRQEAKKISVYKLDECFDNYARSTGLLVLLDGLDEVASANYERVYTALIALSDYTANLSENTSIVLTMRTQLHQQVKDSFRLAFGLAVFVKPFSPSDVYAFLSRWPFTDTHMGPLIYAELTDRPTVREMCTNPLVLAMYVAERQSGADPITPESRTEFYARVVEELLVKRRQRQTGATAGASKLREQREAILGALAYEHLLDKSQPSNSLRWKEAVRVTKTVMRCSEETAGNAFLEISRDTGLVSEERKGESFRFTHLTFCEFLAARESVEGQSHGMQTLIAAHKKLCRDTETGASTRLLEVIPFASGLMPRSTRDVAISEIAELGDNRLLARCFLETKSYEHPAWKPFIEKERNSLLGTAEPEWNEKWLRDLHLFNVVVRDAAQCSKHVASADEQIDLGQFYELLVKKGSGGLSKLLAAYAAQDAAAAFRLAELSDLDLPSQFSGLVVSSADQAPFLSMAVEKLLADPESGWAPVLAEAGLTSKLVSEMLHKRPPDRHTLERLLDSVPRRQRWDVKGITSVSLYTQILTLAIRGLRTGAVKQPLSRLEMLNSAPPPGGLGPFYRYPYIAVGATCLALFLVLHLGPLGRYVHSHQTTTIFDAMSMTHSMIPVLGAYLVLFRVTAVRVFYGVLANRSSLLVHRSNASQPLMLLQHTFFSLLTPSERRLMNVFADDARLTARRKSLV